MRLNLETPIVFHNHGQQLVGMLHTPEEAKTPSPAVVLFHGFGGTKVEAHRILVKTARKLASSGFLALRFDFRGCGDSEGDFSDVTIGGEISDAIKSIDMLTNMKGVDKCRVGALGLSLGGCVAACVSGKDSRIRSTVLWAPVSDNPPDMLKSMLETHMERPNPNEDFTDFWNGNTVGAAFFEELPDIKPSIAIQQFAGALLIIHGENDETVPVSHGKQYYELMKSREASTEIEIVPDADHTFNRRLWENAVIGRSVEWFQRTL